MKPIVDLVAVAYEAPLETREFLHSLERIRVPFTLSIIENRSPSPQVRRLIEQSRHDLEHLEMLCDLFISYQADNVGYARACNFGAIRNESPYLALLNTDTQFLEGAVEGIVQAFEMDQTIGVIGPKTVDSRNRLTHSGIIKRDGRDAHRFWLQQDVGQADDELEVPTVSGATYFVRREAWEELTWCPLYRAIAPTARGAFLPTRHYYEETWCSYHAWFHGWRVMYLGSAKMVHEWHRSSPVGGEADAHWRESEEAFQEALRAHGYEREVSA